MKYRELLNPLRWKKSFLIAILLSFLIAILLAFTGIWFLFLDTYSVYTRYELSRRHAELERRAEQLREETAILETKLKDLQNNADLLEKIAREEYGMRMPGETVYIIEKE